MEHIIYSHIQVLIEGLNLNRLLKQLKNAGVILKHIKKVDYNKLTFFILNKQNKILKNIVAENNCKLEIKKYYGLAYFLYYFKNRLGIYIGAIIFLIILLFLNTFIWNIEVYGLENLQKQEVLNILKEQGIVVGKQYKNNDLEEVERYLESKLNEISMISLMKKGSTILVNLKEVRIPSVMLNDSETGNLVASEAGLVTGLNLVQGTAMVKIGDTIKEGDILIAGYYYNLAGEKINCMAMGEVYAKVWYSATVLFETLKTEYVETGNFSESVTFSLGKTNVIIKEKLPTYDNYKTITSTKYLFSNNLIPIKINKIRYYELTPVFLNQNFDEKRETVKEKALILAKEKVPVGLTILKEFTTIENNGNIILVSAFIECETMIQVLK